MSDALFVAIKGGIQVAVPHSCNGISTWVLLEQEDWFEKEIGFVRRLLKPGMRALDIGANHGVYALTMAKSVAPDGMVWAFEPTRATAALLRESIAHNQLACIDLSEAALSAAPGRARLKLEESSELNRLSAEADGGGEEVEVSTLDHEMARFSGAIDFVKLDAEGEEVNILAGGARFLGEHAPLVMFEARRLEEFNAALPAAFRARGMAIYRLLGPDRFLAPLAPERGLDPFELNLFACGPERAGRLAERGLLLEAVAPLGEAPPQGGGSALFASLPFAASFPALAARRPAGPYGRALDAYALWRDQAEPLPRRGAALLAALDAAREAVAEKASAARASSLARIAGEASERVIAHRALEGLVAGLRGSAPPLDEPFFPASPRFEAIAPGRAGAAWLLAASFEAYERGRAFSGFFHSTRDLELYDWFSATPFASAEMERRRQLLRMRAGLQNGPESSPLLARAGEDNLNPAYWGGR